MNRNKETSLWQRCDELVNDFEWTPEPNANQVYTHARSATWALYPYRYSVTQYGREQSPSLMRRRRITATLARVSMLSALNVQTGLRDYRQYYVPREPGDVHLIGMQLGDLDDPQTAVEMVSNVNFTLDNGLSIANAVDLVELGDILKRAHADGVEPL